MEVEKLNKMMKKRTTSLTSVFLISMSNDKNENDFIGDKHEHDIDIIDILLTLR